MKEELLAYGVPESCIHLEEGSKTTEENARELATLLRVEPFQEKNRQGKECGGAAVAQRSSNEWR